LVAAAVMAEEDHPALPRSMTLMAGPIDTRIAPTKVNELAKTKPIGWFEQNLISRVPWRYKGAGRRVYPGLRAAHGLHVHDMDRHVKAHRDLYDHLVAGDIDNASATKIFYDEYFAVLDLPAEFYLDTVQMIFQEHLLPRGELMWHNRRVNPAAICKTALFTVEGERDDICAVGQTVAATISVRTCAPIASVITCSLASGTMAYSAVGNGKRRSIRCCGTWCWRARRSVEACSLGGWLPATCRLALVTSAFGKRPKRLCDCYGREAEGPKLAVSGTAGLAAG